MQKQKFIITLLTATALCASQASAKQDPELNQTQTPQDDIGTMSVADFMTRFGLRTRNQTLRNNAPTETRLLPIYENDGVARNLLSQFNAAANSVDDMGADVSDEVDQQLDLRVLQSNTGSLLSNLRVLQSNARSFLSNLRSLQSNAGRLLSNTISLRLDIIDLQSSARDLQLNIDRLQLGEAITQSNEIYNQLNERYTQLNERYNQLNRSNSLS